MYFSKLVLKWQFVQYTTEINSEMKQFRENSEFSHKILSFVQDFCIPLKQDIFDLNYIAQTVQTTFSKVKSYSKRNISQFWMQTANTFIYLLVSERKVQLLRTSSVVYISVEFVDWNDFNMSSFNLLIYTLSWIFQSMLFHPML